MRYRLMFGVGLAIGYILGSRAGRERYEEIKRMAQRVSDNPTIQETAGLVGAKVSRATGVARAKVSDVAKNRLSFMRSGDDWQTEKHDESGTGWPEGQKTTPAPY
ncbi:TPP-dependent pyruvate/acetoin dehydrogenase alpha subunit [Streptosporangium becharense]|uniref:TPP-dependent pyruvate/acetoin dehydrogenase alpha subunit n=1 Tax=Streptosporangium becharense TaxID=1816182 RepID=A0A7W9MFQ5_9ACTN|nr:YtxH domain-containing protein [Streptosporangium becharense]MBB2912107.1 TPP-dependent pyruvate/acetoin dehydrogenase alpha subunit [Streptosporangium becharense]MBB5818654.1 TPP-dependent pyruvate/acetoin dehydrogenase alpha subunit [Streptosporangium becharense]